MKSLFLAILAFVALTGSNVEAQRKVVCYYGTWATYRPGDGKFDVQNINPKICTHIIYTFFGLTSAGQVTYLDSGLDKDKGNIQKFIALKQSNPNVKLMAAIGGWNLESTAFSQMSSSGNTRTAFANNVLAFLQNWGFDGIDIDWEYPTQRFGGQAYDKENFILMLAELRNKLSPRNLLVSIAVSAAQSSALKSYDVARVAAQVDFINVMIYDLHGPWETITGIHGAMYAGPNDAQAWQKELNVDACVRFWLNYGTPASKLIVGIPTYGKSFTLANQANHGIGAQSINVGNAGPFTGQGGTLGYNEICLNNWQTVFDNTQQVPYAFSGNQWVGYDNVQSVTVKSNYVVNNNLGGAMIWSLETDDFRGKCGPAYPLLNTIYSIVMSGNVAPTSAPTPAPTQGPTQAPTTKPTTQSPGGPFVCPSSGYFRDPSNCSKYYQCVGQTKYAFDCPSGTVFNTNVSVCDWPANVNC